MASASEASERDLEKGTEASQVERQQHTESTITTDIPADLEKQDVEKGDAIIEKNDTLSGVDSKYIVDWDGPDDPMNPLNWTPRKKWSNMTVVSAITFITPLASSMFAPGVPAVMKEFKSTNVELASFVVSIYILGFAIGPIIIAPLSELYGRLKLYLYCGVLFIIFTILCAVSKNMGMLVAFRFLAGCAGAAPLTIGGGTIGDLMLPEARGAAMAIFAMGPLLGPIVGPVVGGYLTEGAGWRWVFWLLSIASGIVTLMSAIFLKETYAPTLLEAKAAHLRKETGDPAYRSKYQSDKTPVAVFKLAIVRPLKMLFMSPIVFLLSLHVAIVYGIIYFLFTTFTFVFEDIYGFSAGAAGLTFIGMGIGSIIGVIALGVFSDKLLMKLTKENNGVAKPEFRLPPMVYTSLLIPIGLFWYGWSAQKHTHWMVPIIGTSFVGLGMMAVIMPVQNYLIDAYTLYAASAIAAATILRSLFGAVLPLAGQSLYAALGLGWGNSLLGFLALAMAPVPWVFWKYGERIRTRSTLKLD